MSVIVVEPSDADNNDAGNDAAIVAGATAVAVAEAVTDAVQEIAVETIEALRMENAQLRAEVASLREAPTELHIHEETVIIEAEPPVVEEETVEVIEVEDDTPDPPKETTPKDRKPSRRPYGRN
jgi:hypothetical protein